MEKALYIKLITQLKNYSVLSAYNRLYLGSEFCTSFIPSASSLKQCFGVCEKYHLELSLVLPLYTLKETNLIRATLTEVARWRKDTEIVINDLGHLWLLKNEFPFLSRVWGRLLVKLKADERLKISSRKEYQSVPVDQSHTSEFLRENNVSRIELSNIGQGIQRDLSVSPLPASLYLPYVYVATSRKCLSRISKYMITGKPSAGYFTVHNCSFPCRDYHIKISSNRIFSGNSLFYINDRIPVNIREINVNRVVTEKLVFEEIK